MNQIAYGVGLLLFILLFGTSGYMLIEGASFADGLYMTVITITSVGYGEAVPLSPTGKWFTMGLILIGVSFVLYIVSKITETVVEGGLRRMLGRINMEKKLAGLHDHYIVCGYGRIGMVICQILEQNRKPFLVIDNKKGESRRDEEKDYLFLEGEAADDEILLKAGIKRAKGLIAVVSSDADNVYITLSAKGLNPNLFVLARSSGAEGAETKLMRAGADKVISPYFIGATRMAQQIVRPTVVDFIDLTVHGGELGLRLEELSVPPTCKLLGLSLQDSGIRKKFDLIVVAIKRHQGEMVFNPTPNTIIKATDILIVLGEMENIKALEKEL